MRPDLAADVAAVPGILDLHHLRSEVGQIERAGRAGAVLLDCEHAKPGQWQWRLKHR